MPRSRHSGHELVHYDTRSDLQLPMMTKILILRVLQHRHTDIHHAPRATDTIPNDDDFRTLSLTTLGLDGPRYKYKNEFL